MKKHIVRLIALALLCFPLFLRAQTNSFIGVKGKDIITPDGKNFLMRGTNLGN